MEAEGDLYWASFINNTDGQFILIYIHSHIVLRRIDTKRKTCQILEMFVAEIQIEPWTYIVVTIQPISRCCSYVGSGRNSYGHGQFSLIYEHNRIALRTTKT